jgi:hypothetical protein
MATIVGGLIILYSTILKRDHKKAAVPFYKIGFSISNSQNSKKCHILSDTNFLVYDYQSSKNIFKLIKVLSLKEVNTQNLYRSSPILSF